MSGGRKVQSLGAEQLKAGLPMVLRRAEGAAAGSHEENIWQVRRSKIVDGLQRRQMIWFSEQEWVRGGAEMIYDE